MKLTLTFIYLLFVIFLFTSPIKVSAATLKTQVDLFQITTDGSQQTMPAIYKNMVAYTNFGGSQGIDIWGYNLKDQENFPIIEKPGQQWVTDLYNNLVVYEDVNEATPGSDLRIYDLRRHTDQLIAGGPGSQTSGVTNGRQVVYIDGGACGQLYVYDLRRKTTTQIVEFTCHPVRIWNHLVVFPVTNPQGTDIHGYDLLKKEQFPIATDTGFQEVPDIYQFKVVWTDTDTDSTSIVVKNLLSGEQKTLYEAPIYSVNWPSISNKYVVWSQTSAPHVGGVWGYYLLSSRVNNGQAFEIQEQGPHQNSHTMPSIWNDTAVWQSWRTGGGDIYEAEMSLGRE